MQEPVGVIKDIYAAFGRGDIASIIGHLDEQVDFRQVEAPNLPYAGHYKGRAGAAQFFEKLGAAVEVTGFTPEKYLAQGDEVMALGTWSGKARPTGKSFAARWAMYWKVKDGAVVSYVNYEDSGVTSEAFKA